ncbi:MAG TPA: helix-turn-helix transcriptional regulator [Candidatus Baltobacteraceae bacterium]
MLTDHPLGASDYFGNLLRRSVAGPFVITEGAFSSGSALPAHSHDIPYFTFTLRGRYRERCGPRQRLCTPGTAVAHPAFETHAQEFADEPALLIRVALAPGEAEPEVEAALENPLCITSSSIARIVSHMHDELGRTDESSEMIMEGLAYELTGMALHAEGSGGGSRRRALNARAFIRSSLRYPVSLTVLSNQIGVSRATLYRDFKSAFGYTPGDFLRQTRLTAAATLLRKTKMPVSEISAACGFFDQCHFGRSFRETWGVSPSAYRRVTE